MHSDDIVSATSRFTCKEVHFCHAVIYCQYCLQVHLHQHILLKKKKRNAYLVGFRIDLWKFNKKSCSSNFTLQLIQIKVHDLNTLLIQETDRSVGILKLRDTQISRGCPQESLTVQHLLGMDWIRLWITCTGMATHSCWSTWNDSHKFARVLTLPQTHLSNSSQMCLSGLKLIWRHGRQGRIWTKLLAGKYNTLQWLMPKIKPQKSMHFYFWTV